MTNRYKQTALLVAILVPGVINAQEPTHNAIDNYYIDKERGWYWYEDPMEEKKKPPLKIVITHPPKKQAEKPPAQPAKPQGPMVFSAAWIRENHKKILDRAIDNPTDKASVEAYLYLQKLMLDKSQQYSMAVQEIIQNDPLLDENNRMPLATAARAMVISEGAEAKKAILKDVGKKAGLWYFYDSTCSFCLMQSKLVQKLSDRYGIKMLSISLDGKPIDGITGEILVNQGQAETLRIEVVPAIVLVRPPNNYVVLTQGFISLNQLERRVVLAAEKENMIDHALYAKVFPVRQGLIDQRMEEAAIKAGISPDDPAAWVAYLKQGLKGEKGNE